ncbi:MAG TPA: hypothetical protein VLF43_04810 [Candidatus Saccharimonadales bacterium]|nr:hypothetical protein [Candidatus Saccharimonadales bacterium]
MERRPSRNQAKYWSLFYDLSVYFNYLQIYQERDQAVIRYIAIALAITSSSSIAAWAIWQEVSWLWAIIIAASQVLNVSAGFLPYKQREKTLRTVLPQMQKLLLDCEDEYELVVSGELTDHQIHEKTMEFKRQFSDVSNQMYACGLPQKKNYLKEAEARARQALIAYTT